MGYIGSQLIGGLYTTLAFDERCAKIAYLIHAPLWPAVFWFTVGFWPKVQVAITVGWSVGLWFSEWARGERREARGEEETRRKGKS